MATGVGRGIRIGPTNLKGRLSREAPDRPSRENLSYYVLNKPQGAIFEEIAHSGIFLVLENKPNRSRGPKDTSKYCKYHKDFGHNIDDCIMLKDAIEKLIVMLVGARACHPLGV